MDRRSFLRAGVISAAAALAVPAATRASAATPHQPRIAIVGAGLAGLTCAYRLAQAGVRADVYEANASRLGGRCWSNRDFLGGQVAEHGGEFIDSRHRHLKRLVPELGLTLDDRRAGPHPGNGLLVLHGAARRPDDVYRDFPGVLRQLKADARRIGSYFADDAGRAARAFDEQSARDWLLANVPGGANSLLYAVIVNELADEFGGDPQDLSAINLIEQYVTPYPGADERYHVHGGNDLIVAGLARRLPRGALHLDAPLASVARDGSGYTLGFGASGPRVRADRVVFALPFTALRRVELSQSGLSARKRDAIDNHGMGTNAKVHLQFRRRFETLGWDGNLSADKPRWDTWDSSQAEAGRQGLLTIYSGGATGASYPAPQPHGPAPARVVTSALNFLDRYVPGLAQEYDGRCWLDSWVDDPWTHGSYASFRPGQYTRYWGYSGQAEGALHFAGEHTSTFAQGYLEGAVESGERVAGEVRAALGVTA